MPHDKASILLVDDDHDLLSLLSMRLEGAGYTISTADSAEAALSQIGARRPSLVITDVRLGGMDGMVLFERIQASFPLLPVIMLTAHGSIPDAISATNNGVFGYLTKPFDAKVLLNKIEQGIALSASQDAAPDTTLAWRADIISRSPRMEELLVEAKLVAASDASVLISGDSGTGKELLAKAIHRASLRSKRPFVPINCGAIPEQLLESELFGHVRGAFTGALHAKSGLMQTADGGTLFLDEIGDMPLALQVKVLRVLEERTVRPIGALRAEPVDIRIVSATHRNLDEAMTAGRFREDLYYRLNVVQLTLPALAERREDIALLAPHFLEKFNLKLGKKIAGFAPDAMECLLAAPWPGNVRQLYNVVEQCCTLATTTVLPLALVQKAIRDRTINVLSYSEAKRAFERGYLIELLKLTGGNVADAARLAERNRTDFYRLLQRCGLPADLFKS